MIKISGEEIRERCNKLIEFGDTFKIPTNYLQVMIIQYIACFGILKDIDENESETILLDYINILHERMLLKKIS